MITILAFMATQPALAQDCDGPVSFVSIKEGGPILSLDEEDLEEPVEWKSLENGEHRVPIGWKRFFGVVGTDGALVPESCGCQWDLATQNQDTSALSDPFKSGNLGTSFVGSVVEYTPPSDLVECVDEEVAILVSCDGDFGDDSWTTLTLTVTASDSEGNAAATSWERCSVQGGGCLSPQRVGDVQGSEAWLLLPLIGLGGLARRRED